MTGWFALSIVMVGIIWFLLPRMGWISPKHAAELLESGARMVDVRNRNEYSSMHIFGSDNWPLPTLAKFIDDSNCAKDEKLLVFCHSGVRSSIAVKQLRQLGYKKAYNLGSYNRARKAVSLRKSDKKEV